MNDLIIGNQAQLPVFTFATTAVAARDAALGNAALIGAIKNQEQNDIAVRAGMALKSIANQVEKQRKAVKEPLIEAGRQLDRACATFLADIEKEAGRISNLAKDFQIAEQSRIREEQAAQQRELDRIERERQAEIARLAREQAEREAEVKRVQDEIDRKAREEREAAAKAARDATNKKEREAAQHLLAEAARKEEANRIEREKAEEKIKEQAAAGFQRIEETAQASKLAEARPIIAQRTSGQIVTEDYEIEVLNPHMLAYLHPDCVRIEPLLGAIKAALKSGRSIPQVRATKITKAGFRAAKDNTINV